MQEKEAGTNSVLLCQSRNIVGQFIKSFIALTNQDFTFSHTNEN